MINFPCGPLINRLNQLLPMVFASAFDFGRLTVCALFWDTPEAGLLNLFAPDLVDVAFPLGFESGFAEVPVLTDTPKSIMPKSGWDAGGEAPVNGPAMIIGALTSGCDAFNAGTVPGVTFGG